MRQRRGERRGTAVSQQAGRVATGRKPHQPAVGQIRAQHPVCPDGRPPAAVVTVKRDQDPAGRQVARPVKRLRLLRSQRRAARRDRREPAAASQRDRQHIERSFDDDRDGPGRQRLARLPEPEKRQTFFVTKSARTVEVPRRVALGVLSSPPDERHDAPARRPDRQHGPVPEGVGQVAAPRPPG
jgi:hypothetical protein